MVDTKTIKYFVEGHMQVFPSNQCTPFEIYSHITLLETVREIEQLRQDLKEMYELTQELKNVHSGQSTLHQAS